MTSFDPQDPDQDDVQASYDHARGTVERTSRLQMMLGTRRFADAEREARRLLTASPQDGNLHALLGLTLHLQDKDKEAADEAKMAIGLAPELPFAHAVLGWSSLGLNRFDDALAAVREALRLNPYDNRYHALESTVHLGRRKWEDALAAADRGLRIDPQDSNLRNNRAIALRQLGRHAEADRTIHGALEHEPDDAFTHANKGWGLLHARQFKPAGDHFREALRLNPNLEFARDGLLEVLKARNPIYRWLLRWQLWMSTLTGRARWGVIIGLYVAYQMVRTVARNNPDYAVFTYPLIAAYLFFALLTWIGTPFFDATLLLSRFGRQVLPPDRKRSAYLVIALVAVAGIAGLMLAATADVAWVTILILTIGLMLPVSRIFVVAKGWPRWVMISLSSVMFALAAFVSYRLLVEQDDGPVLLAASVYALLVVACLILSYALSGVRVRR